MNILKGKRKYVLCIGLTTILLSTSIVLGLDYDATVIAPESVVRQEKAFDSQKLDKLNTGTKILVKEVLDDWYRVETLGGKTKGWISSEEVVINDNSFKEKNVKRGEVTASVLNVRMGPSTNNARTTQIRRGDIVTIINRSGEWNEVILSNNIKGWVHSDYIKTTYNFPKGSVSSESIDLKQQARNDVSSIGKLQKDQVVYIKDYNNGWYNITTETDREGWVESKDITVLVNKTFNANRSGSSREVFNNVESIASKYIGKRYVYGGNGPNGFDCSGFTSYILKTYYGEYLKHKGINNLPRTASGQANVGTAVSRANLQEGDLVFFNTSGRPGNGISHVGIYIGNDQIIHASTSRGVVKDSLSSRYYANTYVRAVRL